MKNVIVALVSFLFFVFAGATVATAQPRPPACDTIYEPGSCEARACQLERDIDAMQRTEWCIDEDVFRRQMSAFQTRADNLAGACHAAVVTAAQDMMQAMINCLPELCAGRTCTIRGRVVRPPSSITATPRRTRPARRERDRDVTPRPVTPPRQPERQAVVCHSELGAIPTADGQSCQCRQDYYDNGMPVVQVLVNLPQRFSDRVHFGCGDRSQAAINYILGRLRAFADAQDARDRAQEASIRRAQATAIQALERANDAHDLASARPTQRPSSIEERFHIDLLGRMRLVIPGQVGDGAPVALGTGLGLRFRWRCNVCSSRDEFYFAVAGGAGYTGAGVGMTAFGEMGIGYTRYLDRRRVVGLSIGALAYGFGLMGEEAAPTEEGLHGDLRRWGVGGEFLLDFSLTGGSVASRPTRTEVRFQIGVGVTYDTAFWWSSQDGLMESRGIGFAPTIGLIINP